MAINLKQLLNFPPQATIETSIGPLSLFSMKVADRHNTLKSIAEKEVEKDPKNYFKSLLTFICYPPSNLREGKYRPDDTVLTAEDVNRLPDEELEQIAETFLKHNVYLYKKNESRAEKNDEGKEVTRIIYTETEHPKLEGESNLEYVYRLENLQQEKVRKRYELMLNSFPKKLSESIDNTYSMGARVSNAFERAKAVTAIPPTLEMESSSNIMALNAEMLKLQADNHRTPLDELGKRLDILVDVSQKAYEYNRNTFEVQTEIARDIKSGGETTDRHSKFNISLTIFVIFLTIGIAVWSNFSGVTFSDVQQQTLGGYATTVSVALEENAKAMDQRSDASQAALQDIVSALRTLNQSMDSRQVSMNVLKTEIDELKKSNQDYQRKIEVLEAKLNALKAANVP